MIDNRTFVRYNKDTETFIHSSFRTVSKVVFNNNFVKYKMQIQLSDHDAFFISE